MLSCLTRPVETPFRQIGDRVDIDLERLANHIETYEQRSQTYDELFESTSDRIRRRHQADKRDLAALAFWKHLNCNTVWVGRLLDIADEEVCAATRVAFRAIEPGDRYSVLAERLPGCRNWGPYASTILCAYDPENYAVRDRRALVGLQRLGCGIEAGAGLWRRYHERVLELRDALRAVPGWSDATARHVDKGLFDIGG